MKEHILTIELLPDHRIDRKSGFALPAECRPSICFNENPGQFDMSSISLGYPSDISRLS
jgi:hypothetical protein